MRMLAQALKLCFWALPAQRVIVIAGFALTLVTCLAIAPFNQSGRVLEFAVLGQLRAFLPASSETRKNGLVPLRPAV